MPTSRRSAAWLAVVLVIWAMGSVFAAADAGRPGHSMEISWGRISGSGLDDVTGFNRRTPDIDNGERWRFRGEYGLSTRWFLHGEYETARLSYQNPLFLGCPPNAAFFLGTFLCQPTIFVPRDPPIADTMRTWSLGLGFRQPIGQRFRAIAELSYMDMRWRTRQDVEALAAARCLGFGSSHNIDPQALLRTAQPVAGCIPVREPARRDGLQGALRFAFDVSGTLEAQAYWQVRQGRHTPYRNDLYPRFFAVNCSHHEACGHTGWMLHNLEPVDESATSSWFGARATVRFDRHWVGFLNVEAGGSRDWTVVDAGIGYRF